MIEMLVVGYSSTLSLDGREAFVRPSDIVGATRWVALLVKGDPPGRPYKGAANDSERGFNPPALCATPLIRGAWKHTS